MSTNTIRFEESFKSRVAAAAVQAGMSYQAFLQAAIAERVAEVERDAAFYRTPPRRAA